MEKKQKTDRGRKRFRLPGKTFCGKRYGLLDYGIGFVIGAAVGFGVGYVLFHNLMLEIALGGIAGVFMSREYVAFRIRKRKQEFLSQFCDFLDSLSASLSCGKNAYESFLSADSDMRDLYRADAAVCKESVRMADGLKTGRPIPELLSEMAKDSDSGDVRTFGELFSVASRAGGNLKKVTDDTRNMLVEKLAVEEEIQTILAGPKNELNVMAIMPLAILASLRILGGGFVTDDGTSIVVNAIAFVVFFISYLMGRKIVDIEV